MMSMNVVFLGAPGSGKGTQSKNLIENFGYRHVSTGDLLRAEIKKGSELGKKVKDVMDRGELVTDELVTDLLKANIDLEKNHYIFDGFPRNLSQAKILESILGTHSYKAIYFDVDTEALVKRITNRRVSTDGKHIYNLIFSPPRKEGVCDVSGLPLVQREDDKEEVVRNRMDVFNNEINPVLDFYKEKNALNTVDADKSIDEVKSLITKAIS
jgi:adenylate kinase